MTGGKGLNSKVPAPHAQRLRGFHPRRKWEAQVLVWAIKIKAEAKLAKKGLKLHPKEPETITKQLNRRANTAEKEKKSHRQGGEKGKSKVHVKEEKLRSLKNLRALRRNAAKEKKVSTKRGAGGRNRVGEKAADRLMESTVRQKRR